MLTRLAAASLLVLLTGCGGLIEQGSVDAPELGACRELAPDDIPEPDNESDVVRCSEEHTAETFAVGNFPDKVAKGASVDDPKLGAYIYKACTKRFQSFLDGDESTVMRSLLTWVWFRPTEDAWSKGARWYRCDVVSGSEHSDELRSLPKKTQGLLLERPDAWMSCANGDAVATAEKVPCTDPHNWRAVTTIQVGRDEDPYPGDQMVEQRTRDFCSDSVSAWLNYPVDYDFGYTFYREAEWEAGNRRSICWAKTDK